MCVLDERERLAYEKFNELTMKLIFFFLESFQNLTPDDMPLIDLTLMLFGSKHTKQTPADRI